jgi:hypothetical protein
VIFANALFRFYSISYKIAIFQAILQYQREGIRAKPLCSMVVPQTLAQVCSMHLQLGVLVPWFSSGRFYFL